MLRSTLPASLCCVLQNLYRRGMHGSYAYGVRTWPHATSLDIAHDVDVYGWRWFTRRAGASCQGHMTGQSITTGITRRSSQKLELTVQDDGLSIFGHCRTSVITLCGRWLAVCLRRDPQLMQLRCELASSAPVKGSHVCGGSWP